MSKLILNRYKGKPPITVLIDDEDYPKVSKYIWHIMALGYINGSVKNKRFYLHRFIMNAPSNKVVDHINGNKLDNRKCNLRLCSIRDNVLNCKISKNNKSGTSGVSFRKDRGKYRSYIMVNRKQIFLGYYKEIKCAIDARKDAEIKYFGIFAHINGS